MPKQLPSRNKAIIHLLKLGWPKYEVSQLFQKYGWAKSAIYLVMRRDFHRYTLPTERELKDIEDRYNIEIAEYNVKVASEKKNNVTKHV